MSIYAFLQGTVVSMIANTATYIIILVQFKMSEVGAGAAGGGGGGDGGGNNCTTSNGTLDLWTDRLE